MLAVHRSGNQITVPVGVNATCTINNDDVPPFLKLVKTVTNDNGGNAIDDDWNLTATANVTTSTSFWNYGGSGDDTPILANNTYTLSELGPANYTAGIWSCVGGTQSGNQITVPVGVNATCTINNDDVPPFLKLVKTVTNDNGGDAIDDDWNLTATANVTTSTSFWNYGGSGDDTPILANNTYTLSELGPANYTAGSWSCVGGTQSGNQITVPVGVNATCTINNDDVPPFLKLVKTVTNDNGGDAIDDDWNLTATANVTTSTSFWNYGGSGDDTPILANNTYTLSELGPANYTAGSWSCVGGTQSGNQITVPVGVNATCTINNDDVPPFLKLVKTVTNDNGGDAIDDDWNLTATANVTTSTSFWNYGGSGDDTPILANNTYTLSELGPANYTAGSWSCVGGTQSGNQITVPVGVNATCTINNDDVPPFLKLVKKVISNDGGNKTAGNWTLYANANNPANSTHDFDNLGDAGDLTQVFANIVYNLTESDVDGYVFDGWECKDDLTNDTISTSDQVSLYPAQNATCTVTNDDVPAFLKIIKNTTDDSFDDRGFIFQFFVTDNNGDTTTVDVIVNASDPSNIANHTGMSDKIFVPSGSLNVTEFAYTNWSLLNVQCEIFQLDEEMNKIESLYNTTDSANLNLESFHLAECTFVNWNPHGYITGGGRIDLNATDPNHQVDGQETVEKVTHGFQLHCNTHSGPNNLEVNWNGNKFHLDELERTGCFDDDSMNEPPPTHKGKNKPTLDIYHGEGWGRYNGECGAFASWTIDDNSEPGKEDHIIALEIYENQNATSPVLRINHDQLNIMDTSSAGTWKDPGPSTINETDPWINLQHGNHQWVPHPSKAHGPTHTTPCPEITNNTSTDGPDPVEVNATSPLTVIDNDLDGISTINEKLGTFGFATDPFSSDTDNDGLTDTDEIVTYGTDPTIPDVDSDGLLDGDEILYGTGPFVADTDADGLSDGAEVNTHGTDPLAADTDSDGLSDNDELNTHGTDPLAADTDSDGLSDNDELNAHGTDPLVADTDADGLSDGAEVNTTGTDPLVADTDADGLSDGAEVNTTGTDPLVADTDADGLSDGAEVNTTGTDPLVADTDADGLSDGAEINTHGTDPLVADTDADGLSDESEVNTHGTDPLVADTDADGLSDGAEVNTHGTDPLVADTDADGLSDGAEVNTTGTDPLVADTDADGLSDESEVNTHGTDPLVADTDADGLSDGAEINTHGTDPLVADTDADGLSDGAEVNTHGTDPLVADTDADGLSDGAEVNTHGTDPLVADTDADGLSDGAEINTHGTDPLVADTDADGLSDESEVNTHGTDPLVADTDADGLSDGAEINTHGTDPLVADTDADGLSDGAEINTHGTDPLVADTDADGLSDGAEINTHGTDPLVADTDSGGVNDGDEIINGLNPLKRNDDRHL